MRTFLLIFISAIATTMTIRDASSCLVNTNKDGVPVTSVVIEGGVLTMPKRMGHCVGHTARLPFELIYVLSPAKSVASLFGKLAIT